MKIALPWWLVLIVVIETVPMFLGPVAALTRPGFMGGPEAETINQAAYIYTARNVAVGVALLFALALRSGPMLFILILVRLITDIIDLPTILNFDVASNEPRVIAIFVFLYYIPAGYALWWLWREMRRGGEPAPEREAP
ncbi:MAG: hypothetical protein U5R48_11165 [Gammaproteobacteria bacterium]|nr:hypothetical protein [Gammaproteobacteria bacterium]